MIHFILYQDVLSIVYTMLYVVKIKSNLWFHNIQSQYQSLEDETNIFYYYSDFKRILFSIGSLFWRSKTYSSLNRSDDKLYNFRNISWIQTF